MKNFIKTLLVIIAIAIVLGILYLEEKKNRAHPNNAMYEPNLIMPNTTDQPASESPPTKKNATATAQ